MIGSKQSMLKYFLGRIGIIVINICILLIVVATNSFAFSTEYYVSPSGSDTNIGTFERPFGTLSRAQEAVKQAKKDGSVTVWIRGGVYYLPDALIFSAMDSGTVHSPILYQAWHNEQAIISGGQKLILNWEPYRNGIMRAKVPDGLMTDQLFVNGQRQILARYPNFDPQATIFNGYAADALSPTRVAYWADPRGGFIHTMQDNLWGSLDYVITGKDSQGNVTYEGGWQINRPSATHKEYQFVENIFEELDAPGEWFLNTKTSTLYYYPQPGVNLKTATIETVRLRQLIEFDGSATTPVKFITLSGLTFHGTARTFMDTKEPLLRSDWKIYRGGAVFFNGAENCSVVDCDFDQLGGNTIFVNNFNRNIAIRGCIIKDSGASGICFVGNPKAVRSPLFGYDQRQSFNQMNKTPGPKSSDYPADCLVEDCLITRIGRVEKQSAGVEISMSRDITVRHCSIYDMPRAGINIGDGCWGGNIIEFCDVFDTVLETGDHGSFNSWGRDRYWELAGASASKLPSLALLDTVRPNILRNNRWRCDHGWDIDLDDGSSNYVISNNLCLNGGIKLREGFHRVCENNIMANNSLHPHVWFTNSQDIFCHNIVFTEYKPIRVNRPWGKKCDFNLLQMSGRNVAISAETIQQQSGADEHSLEADAMFENTSIGDYRVNEDSPALKLGFKNFPMNQFGVTSPRLKVITLTSELPISNVTHDDDKIVKNYKMALWAGATIDSLEDEEYSAIGVSKNSFGVIIRDVPKNSKAAKCGLKTSDLIETVNAKLVHNAAEFMNVMAMLTNAQQVQFGLVRDQNKITNNIPITLFAN